MLASLAVTLGEAAKPALWKVSLNVSGFATMGEAAKPGLFEVVHVSKLEEVSHEMLVFKLQHVYA